MVTGEQDLLEMRLRAAFDDAGWSLRRWVRVSFGRKVSDDLPGHPTSFSNLCHEAANRLDREGMSEDAMRLLDRRAAEGGWVLDLLAAPRYAPLVILAVVIGMLLGIQITLPVTAALGIALVIELARRARRPRSVGFHVSAARPLGAAIGALGLLSASASLLLAPSGAPGTRGSTTSTADGQGDAESRPADDSDSDNLGSDGPAVGGGDVRCRLGPGRPAYDLWASENLVGDMIAIAQVATHDGYWSRSPYFRNESTEKYVEERLDDGRVQLGPELFPEQSLKKGSVRVWDPHDFSRRHAEAPPEWGIFGLRGDGRFSGRYAVLIASGSAGVEALRDMAESGHRGVLLTEADVLSREGVRWVCTLDPPEAEWTMLPKNNVIKIIGSDEPIVLVASDSTVHPVPGRVRDGCYSLRSGSDGNDIPTPGGGPVCVGDEYAVGHEDRTYTISCVLRARGFESRPVCEFSAQWE